MKTAVRSLGGFRPMKAQQDNTKKDDVFTFARSLIVRAITENRPDRGILRVGLLMVSVSTIGAKKRSNHYHLNQIIATKVII